MKPYTLYLITLAMIVAGALNWGLVGAFGVDAVKGVLGPNLASVVYIAIGAAALLHVFKRDYYLPFLGDSAFPCGPLTPKAPVGANVAVEIQTEPNANIVYWAAEQHTDRQVKKNPWIAYDAYLNSGVTRSDDTGKAVLRVRNPVGYIVPVKGELMPHIHYRVCTQHGMLSRVETAYIGK